MTADHAGQTGGEREHGHRWVQVTQMQDRRERLICAEPTCRARAWGQPLPVAEQAALHEWECPSCGAITRARMADHPGQEREREEAAVDALMWAALTVEHSPGIKHQAKAVTAIRDRAAALRAAPGQEQP